MMALIGITLLMIGAATADSESILVPAIMIAVGLTLCRLAAVRSEGAIEEDEDE